MDFTPGSENRKILNQDFFQDKYTEFRKWYFSTHTKKQIQDYKLQYYTYLEEIQVLFPFPLWYVQHVQIPATQLNVLDNIQRKWLTTDGQEIYSVHPPTQPLELQPTGNNNKPMTIAAYTDIPHKNQNRDPVLIQDIIPVLKQNNYTNLFCQTAGKQLTRIEEIVVHAKKSCNLESKSKSPDIEPVLIKPTPVLKDFKLKSKEETEFMDTLLSKIKGLHISEPSPTSTSQVLMLSSNHIGSSEETYDS